MRNKNIRQCLKDDDFDTPFEKIKSLKHKQNSGNRFHSRKTSGRVIFDTHNFKCVQCGLFVNADRELSGVNNRNHCPRCLWSRHVDLASPGDRKADCMSRMEPIGLTIKQTLKRYGLENQGELMLVHRCTGCERISINRIAADDEALAVYQLFVRSYELDLGLKKLLEKEGIFLLGARDLTTVYTQLFGWQSIAEEFQSPEKRDVVLEPDSDQIVPIKNQPLI